MVAHLKPPPALLLLLNNFFYLSFLGLCNYFFNLSRNGLDRRPQTSGASSIRLCPPKDLLVPITIGFLGAGDAESGSCFEQVGMQR